MFGTLRYVPLGGNHGSYITQVSSQRVPGRKGSGEHHFACERCRSKKLKCSGQKSGCNRCKAVSSTCTYLKAANHEGSRRRKKLNDAAKRKTRSPTILTPPPTSATLSPTATTTSELQPKSESAGRLGDETTKSDDNSSNNTHRSGTENRILGASPVWPNEPNFIDMLDWSGPLDNPETRDFSNSIPFSTGFGLESMNDNYDDEFSISQMLMTRCFPFENPFAQAESGFPIDSPQNQPLDPLHGSFHRSMLSPSHFPQSMLNTSYQSTSQQDAFPTFPATPRNSFSLAPSHEDVSMFSNQNMPIEGCKCLQSTVAILEEIESQTFSDNNLISIDTMMNFHQNALLESTLVLLCQNCGDRTDRIMLLVMVCEKLTNLCENAAAKCLDELQRLENGLITPPSYNDNWGPNVPELAHTGKDAPVTPCISTCGNYRVKQPKEWLCLLKMVISFQLQSLAGFLKQMNLSPFVTRRETVNCCELRVHKLILDLQKI